MLRGDVVVHRRGGGGGRLRRRRAVRAGAVRVRVRRERSDHRRPKGPAGDAQRRRRDRLLPYRRPGRLSAHRPVQVGRRQRFHRTGGPRTGRRRARAKGRRRPGARRRPGPVGRPGALHRGGLGPGTGRRPVRRRRRRPAGTVLLLAAVVVRVRLPAVLVVLAVLAVFAVPVRQPVPVHRLLPVQQPVPVQQSVPVRRSVRVAQMKRPRTRRSLLPAHRFLVSPV